MGIASTHYITKDFAKKIIIEKIETVNDRQLETILEVAIHNGFYNFLIADEQFLKDNKEKEYPCPTLEEGDYIPEYNDAY